MRIHYISTMANYSKGVDASPYRHGMRKTRLYRTWANVKRRCYNKNHDKYHYYGGRGIKMDNSWKEDFIHFMNWALTSGYKDDLSIDRIDVNGNYEPSNCRWATKLEQMNNRRDTVMIHLNGVNVPAQEVARMTGYNIGTIMRRIKLGWNGDRIVNTEPLKGRNQYQK